MSSIIKSSPPEGVPMDPVPDDVSDPAEGTDATCATDAPTSGVRS